MKTVAKRQNGEAAGLVGQTGPVSNSSERHRVRRVQPSDFTALLMSAFIERAASSSSTPSTRNMSRTRSGGLRLAGGLKFDLFGGSRSLIDRTLLGTD